MRARKEFRVALAGMCMLAFVALAACASPPKRGALRADESQYYVGTWTNSDGTTLVITQGTTGVELKFSGAGEVEAEPGYIGHGVLYTTDRLGQITFGILKDNQTFVLLGGEFHKKGAKEAR